LDKLLDNSEEKRVKFKTDLKELFEYPEGGVDEVSLYIKGLHEVQAGGVQCRPTIFVLEKLLQELGFYSMDVRPTVVSGKVDGFFRHYSPRDMSVVMTYIHLGLIENKVVRLPAILRKGSLAITGTKKARKEAEKAKEEERKYASSHKVNYNFCIICYNLL